MTLSKEDEAVLKGAIHDGIAKVLEYSPVCDVESLARVFWNEIDVGVIAINLQGEIDRTIENLQESLRLL